MKNWFKFFEHPECDILIRKSYSEEDDAFELIIIIYDDESGIEMTQKMGFKSQEQRDRVFEDVPAEKVIDFAEAMLILLHPNT